MDKKIYKYRWLLKRLQEEKKQKELELSLSIASKAIQTKIETVREEIKSLKAK